MFKRLREDIATVMAHDPAARSRLEVLLCYSGVHAVACHRFAHWLWRHNLTLAARFVSQTARFITGIEIHPGAVIGRRLFIDHGMGVVIGGTAEVGDGVTLYQGVTLGGTSLERGVKRHPTLADGVIIGAGASVLGPFTVGEGARIGANAVVVAEVPPGATVVGIPAKQVGGKRRPVDSEKDDFLAYGTPESIPDPVARALDGLLDEVSRLRARVEELENGGVEDDEVASPSVGATRRQQSTTPTAK
ncbi:MAG TPA: serine O-acetyltransferase [Alphaproteobacteria bacterium]|jgi:serine O-acetyltransferase|nr:serine O-acetyltransferase [Alphaproteobacteria bacterium]